MNIEERTNVLKTALINSFVDDHKAYKNTIRLINKDFKKSKINYRYSYDIFCNDFLKQTLINSKEIDIFNSNSKFYFNFWQFRFFQLNDFHRFYIYT